MFIYKALLIILFCFSFAEDKQIYSTVQMMDQVMILDSQSLAIEESIMTEFGNSNMHSPIKSLSRSYALSRMEVLAKGVVLEEGEVVKV